MGNPSTSYVTHPQPKKKTSAERRRVREEGRAKVEAWKTALSTIACKSPVVNERRSRKEGDRKVQGRKFEEAPTGNTMTAAERRGVREEGRAKVEAWKASKSTTTPVAEMTAAEKRQVREKGRAKVQAWKSSELAESSLHKKPILATRDITLAAQKRQPRKFRLRKDGEGKKATNLPSNSKTAAERRLVREKGRAKVEAWKSSELAESLIPPSQTRKKRPATAADQQQGPKKPEQPRKRRRIL